MPHRRPSAPARFATFLSDLHELTFFPSLRPSSLLTTLPSTSALISFCPRPLAALTDTLALSHKSEACRTSCWRLSQSGRGIGMRSEVAEMGWGVRLSEEA
jgi:hypothetical protein